MELQSKIAAWKALAKDDQSLLEALSRQSPAEVEEAFTGELAFGTAGLRGIMGLGPNRMNQYTVARASLGLARYVAGHFAPEERAIAIGYDTRNQSRSFAETAAGVFAGQGLSVWLYEAPLPTPCLSWAVRELHCAAGVMVTASHNSAQWNGYKVYGPDGCQITTQAAREITADIQQVDPLQDLPDWTNLDPAAKARIQPVPTDCMEAYLSQVLGLAPKLAPLDRKLSIVYTPLNGTGRQPVQEVLSRAGFTGVFTVPEQEQPDGDFPTCPSPNPEKREALSLALEYARDRQADLVIGTDPDCDRMGVAVRNEAGDYTVLTGNEVGALLLDFLCAARKRLGTLPEYPVFLKTIVTTDLARRIADAYGVETRQTLIGFKYLGEQIGLLEQAGRATDFLFGFEESCGYLSGPHVRDKDGVNAALLMATLAAFCRASGTTLLDRLEALYTTHGYTLDTQDSYTFQGLAGKQKMGQVMADLRKSRAAIGPYAIAACRDYLQGVDNLPQEDCLEFCLDTGDRVIIRPSGTEPKLKVYLSVTAPDKVTAKVRQEQLHRAVESLVK